MSEANKESLEASDGFGSVWGPCPYHGIKLTVIRPGKAVCQDCEDEWFKEQRRERNQNDAR